MGALISARKRRFVSYLKNFKVFGIKRHGPIIISTMRGRLTGRPLRDRRLLSPLQTVLTGALTTLAPNGLGCDFFYGDNARSIRTTLGLTGTCRSPHNGFAFVTADNTFRNGSLNTLSTATGSAFHGPFVPLLPKFHRIPFNGVRTVHATLGRYGGANSSITTIVLRPVRNRNNMVLPPPNCLATMHGLYSRFNTLVVLSRMRANVKHANGVFTYRRRGMRPSVLYLTGTLNNNIVPVNTAVTARRIFSILFSGPFLRAAAFNNGPLTYTTTLTAVGILLRRGLPTRTRRGNSVLLSNFHRLTQRCPSLMRRTHNGKVLVTVRFISGRVNCGFTDRVFHRHMLITKALGGTGAVHVRPPLALAVRRYRLIVGTTHGTLTTVQMDIRRTWCRVK